MQVLPSQTANIDVAACGEIASGRFSSPALADPWGSLTVSAVAGLNAFQGGTSRPLRTRSADARGDDIKAFVVGMISHPAHERRREIQAHEGSRVHPEFGGQFGTGLKEISARQVDAVAWMEAAWPAARHARRFGVLIGHFTLPFCFRLDNVLFGPHGS
jgi:hypothetical protein